MADESIIRRAEFNSNVKGYWLWSAVIASVCSFFGIFLLPLIIPLVLIIGDRRLKAMECNLTEKSLQVKRGVWFRFEKTIPLDKITDLAIAQGPLMRALNLTGLSVETAGSSQAGALVQLVGVVDAEAFRDAVLHQKDIHAGLATGAPAAVAGGTSVAGGSDHTAILAEIRDSLLRIEEKLGESE
jgi:putative membrane protein